MDKADTAHESDVSSSDASVQGTARVPNGMYDPIVNQSRSEKMRGNQNPLKADVSRLKRALKLVPLTEIDRRTSIGAEIVRKREQIFSDLGGAANVSELQADLVERYLRSTILIESIDSWLFQQVSLVNRRKRSIIPIVQQRTQLVNLTLSLAQAIGLKRVPPPMPSLQDILRAKASQGQASQEKQATGAKA